MPVPLRASLSSSSFLFLSFSFSLLSFPRFSIRVSFLPTSPSLPLISAQLGRCVEAAAAAADIIRGRTNERTNERTKPLQCCIAAPPWQLNSSSEAARLASSESVDPFESSSSTAVAPIGKNLGRKQIILWGNVPTQFTPINGLAVRAGAVQCGVNSLLVTCSQAGRQTPPV